MKKIAIATFLVVALWATAAAQPCSVTRVGPITASGLSVSNPAAVTFCREMNPGSLNTIPNTPCAVTVRRITAPGLEVVNPEGGHLFPGGGGGVGNACPEGTEFTLTVPVNTWGNTAQYRWYRDGVLIPGAQGTLTANGTSIAYTIPEDEAFGTGDVVFHFMYTLSDDCDAWTRSDSYPIIFWEPVAFCREMYEGSLLPIPASRCYVTVRPIAAPAVNVVNPPSLHTFCTAMDAGWLMEREGHPCHATVRTISAQGITVINPVAARAGIIGFLRGLFN